MIPDENTVKDYWNIRKQLEGFKKDMIDVIQLPNYCLEFLQPGRVIKIKTPDGVEFGWGVVVNFMQRSAPKANEPAHRPQESYFVDCCLPISKESEYFSPSRHVDQIPKGVKPEVDDGNTKWEIVPCLLNCLEALSSVRIFLPEKLMSNDDKEQVGRRMKEVERRFPDGIPILDPLEHMGIQDESFKKLLRKIEVLESRLVANPLHGSALLPGLYDQYAKKEALAGKIKEKKKEIAKAHSIAQLDELKSRKRVLRRLGFINETDVVQMKARVACEISSTEGHELVLSELLFDRFFNEMSPEKCAAVLSCFIFDEKVEAQPLKEELDKPFREIQAKARVIAKISAESKLEVNEDEYVESLRFQLMETVYAWAQGKKFSEVW
jgi:ATP-dependent RNA helicase DOB1